MKPFNLILPAILFSLVLLIPSSFAYDSGYERLAHLFSLDFLAQVQERDVVEKGDQLIGLKLKGDAVSTRLLVRGGVRPVPPIELYGLIGGANLSIDEFNGFDAKMNLAYGGGLHLTLYQSPFPRALDLFADAQYLQFTTKDRIETEVSGVQTLQDEEIRWTEYVAKIGLVGDYDFLRPYGGIRFSLMRGKDLLSVSGKLKLEEDENLGIFGGTDIFLDPTKKAALNLEFTLFDANSISAGLRLAF